MEEGTKKKWAKEAHQMTSKGGSPKLLCDASIYIPLSRSQSHVHNWMQEKLTNILCILSSLMLS